MPRPDRLSARARLRKRLPPRTLFKGAAFLLLILGGYGLSFWFDFSELLHRLYNYAEFVL